MLMNWGNMFSHKVRIGSGSFKLDRKTVQSLLDYVVLGCPAPPPDLVKFATIAYYQKLTGYRIFVETGTYLGETLANAAAIFDKCYSVELSADLYRRAKDRFKSQNHVELRCGSSADLLPEILRLAQEPAIVWLDAHHSGGITAGEGGDPLQQELQALLKCKEMRHVILIDDARGLGVTSEQLCAFIKEMGDNYYATVLHDSIRVIPGEIPLLGPPLM